MNRKLKFLDNMDDNAEIRNYSYTENGAIAYGTTENPVLDAFGCLPSMRNSSCKEILDIFYGAFNFDAYLSMRLLFYIRDIRGGQGARRVFRVITRSLAYTNPELVVNNLDNFLFFGRGDDVLNLFDTPVEKDVIEWIGYNICCDMMTVEEHNGFPSLLAKWLPSENASSKETVRIAHKVRKGLKMSPKEYRKTLTKLRNKINIVETLMSNGKWDDIDFGKVPSKASILYSNAFYRNSQERYLDYIGGLANGDSKVNSNALFPVDIIKKVRYNKNPRKNEELLLDAMWKSLPNYFDGLDESGICCVDTSGSMCWGSGTLPIDVALSLGIYCANKCKGVFKNKFITFSSHPEIRSLVGKTITEVVKNMGEINAFNTNIESVFDLILNTAIENNSPQEDLPSKLYIISDMQFDTAKGARNDKPFMKIMKNRYEKYGYKLPMLVYWNVGEKSKGIYPSKFDGVDCAMVSGYSPSLFRDVIRGTVTVEVEEVVDNGDGNAHTRMVEKEHLEPLEVMNKALMDERYDRVFTG